jgi:hypothetical protein
MVSDNEDAVASSDVVNDGEVKDLFMRAASERRGGKQAGKEENATDHESRRLT